MCSAGVYVRELEIERNRKREGERKKDCSDFMIVCVRETESDSEREGE